MSRGYVGGILSSMKVHLIKLIAHYNLSPSGVISVVFEKDEGGEYQVKAYPHGLCTTTHTGFLSRISQGSLSHRGLPRRPATGPVHKEPNGIIVKGEGVCGGGECLLVAQTSASCTWTRRSWLHLTPSSSYCPPGGSHSFRNPWSRQCINNTQKLLQQMGDELKGLHQGKPHTHTHTLVCREDQLLCSPRACIRPRHRTSIPAQVWILCNALKILILPLPLFPSLPPLLCDCSAHCRVCC